MATAEQLRNIVVLHHIGLNRYSRPVIKRILNALQATQIDIENQLKERLGNGENATRDPTSLRLNSLLEQVRLTQEEGHRAIRAQLELDIDDIITNEAEFANGFMRVASGVGTPNAIGASVNLATVSAEQLRAAVMARPFQGLHLRDWMSKFADGDKQRMRGQITMGYLEGESVPQMIRRIRNVAPMSQRGAEMMVRTSVNHINSQAIAENIKANPDLFPRYQWVSILDNRTTPICRHNSGKVFPQNKGPMPPAHPNCRSTVFPISIGMDPAEDLGYKQWIEKQSEETQKDVLGPKRYKLWKEGKMPVEKFIDNGQSLTLEQLRKRDAAAFKAAGLDVQPPKIVPPKPAPPPEPKPAPVDPAVRNRRLDDEAKAYVLDRGRKETREHLVSYDAMTGAQFSRNDGTKNFVGIPPDMLEAIKDPGRRVIAHHNHPSSSSFSKADLMIMSDFPGMKGLWAHGHNGSAYYVERGSKTLRVADYESARSVTERGFEQFFSLNGGKTAENVGIANKLFHHALNEGLHRAGRIDYRATLTGEMLEGAEKIADTIDTIANRVKGYLK